MNSHFKEKIFILFVILIVAFFLGIAKGAVSIPLRELLAIENRQILYLRLLRALVAILSGSGLAVCGVVLQAILRNPLAEPYLLGTSSGAGLGAVFAIILGISNVYLPLAAFLGAIFAIILVYNFAKQGNKIPVQSLILSGVIVSMAISATMVSLISFSSNESLYGITWWLWGSLQVYDFKLIYAVSAVVILGIFVIYIFSQDLNAISIGEEQAMHLGINTETVKKILFFITAFIIASLVSICGIIGFVGLIIPHIMRFFFGSNHKVLIPAVCLFSSAFMLMCDVLSRTLFPPLEIPIGVITAIIGAPVFIILLKAKQKIT